MKITKKELLSSLLFLLGLLVLLTAANQFLKPKDNQVSSRTRYSTAQLILEEPDNTVDVLLVGDSEACAFFAPLPLWNAYGIPAYACSTIDQSLNDTWEITKMALSHQNPRLVLLETNTFYRRFSMTDILDTLSKNALPILQYHDRWKNFTLRDLNWTVEQGPTAPHKGYYPSTEIVPDAGQNYMEFTQELSPIDGKNRMYIRKIADLCAQREIPLVLISSPSCRNWEYSRHNAVAALAQELGVPYVDLNLELSMDWSRDSRDGGDHLNDYGAKKATLWLNEYIHNLGLFEDRRQNPAYTRWNADWEENKEIYQDWQPD